MKRSIVRSWRAYTHTQHTMDPWFRNPSRYKQFFFITKFSLGYKHTFKLQMHAAISVHKFCLLTVLLFSSSLSCKQSVFKIKPQIWDCLPLPHTHTLTFTWPAMPPFFNDRLHRENFMNLLIEFSVVTALYNS